MTKRVFIIHGWGYKPEKNWYPWLKQELEKKGYEVSVPLMPHPDLIDIKEWVGRLAKVVGNVDENTYFVGHSIGCQTIIRYLGSQKQQCGGAVFVGGWFMLTKEATKLKQDKKLAEQWLVSPISFEQAKLAMKQSVAILSDDDPFVPVENAEVFEKTLGTRVVMQKKKGHFEEKEYPIIMKEFMQVAK